jgi:hypothetical protein
MAMRIKTLEDQIASAEEQLAQTRGEISTASDAVHTVITDQAAGFKAEIDALQSATTTNQATLDAQLARNTDAFAASQDENARKFQLQTEEFLSEVHDLRAQAEAEVEENASKVQAVCVHWYCSDLYDWCHSECGPKPPIPIPIVRK